MGNDAKRSLKVNLSEQASAKLKQMAAELGVSETEVLRKGLYLLAVYTEATKQKGKLVIKQGGTDREIIVV